MKTILILLNKFIHLGCRIFGKKGTSLPGSIIYKFDKHILDKIKYPKYVIGITGSSGKGSTTSLVAHILKSSGLKVVYNKNGSNGVYGIITLVLNNSKLNGTLKGDVLLLELDERQIKYSFKQKVLTHVLITNVTRDQPARNIHPDIIYDVIRDNISDNIPIILNADDPIVNKLKYSQKGPVKTYGVAKMKDSYDKVILNSLDSSYCPLCNAKLNYDFYHYGHIGSYHCPKCEFKRDKVDYEATDIYLEKQTMLINGNKVFINKNILYAIYYTLAAYSLCKEIGISENIILNALNENISDTKRGKTYNLANRNLNILESKNENNLSYYQSLKYINNFNSTKTIIIGFDAISTRYRDKDLSWLWDIEFEMFNDQNIDKIICIGKFKYDIATRLIYAGIDKNKIIYVEDVNNLLEVTKNETKGEIFTITCFLMSSIIKNMLQGGKK